jgi:catechol 2,3-dioxygenase
VGIGAEIAEDRHSREEVPLGLSTVQTFGGSPSAEPATPGSFGIAPSGFRLPPGTAVGAVRLQVADLARSIDYYGGVLGLAEFARQGSTATLGVVGGDGRAATPLVELQERPGAEAVRPRGRLGLFHFALLLPDRASLGAFVVHLGEAGVRAGAGDHLVSESFYLQDPDGLGIEVYADRPRDRWRRVGRELQMATDLVDVASLVHEAGGRPWTGMPAGTVMGHLHLHVGDLAEATRFYSEAVGLDRTVWGYPGALFLAADNYHHHLGTNLWAGAEARPPGENEAQLLEWRLELPEASDVEAVRESLERNGFAAAGDGAPGAAEILVRDPWGTSLRLRVRSS